MADDAEAAVAEAGAESAEGAGAGSDEQPTSWVNPDGSFKDGWEAALVPQDFRGHAVYKAFKDLPGAMKQLGHQALLIARQGKGVFPPTDKSLPAEVEAFYTAIGRPKTADGYKIGVPDDLKDYFDGPMLAETREMSHKAGFTQKQVDLVVALDLKRLKDGLKEQTESEKADRATAEAGLRETWGGQYEARMHLANRVISENVADEDKEALLALVGNNPLVAKLLGTVGEKFMEAHLIDGEKPGALTLQSRIDEAMHQPAYMDASHPGHKATVQAVARLFEEKAKLTAGKTARP